jgi:hypothetical protein
VDPGCFGAEHAEGCFDFGARVVAAHAQRHRQGPGQRVQAAIVTRGQVDTVEAPERIRADMGRFPLP